MRLTGLINSSAYINTPEERFLSVKFYIADASGAAASTRKLYPIVNNTTWTESNVTWNSINSSYFSGNSELTGTHGYASVGRGNYAAFDITGLVQKWKFGLYNANCGFMLIGTNTSSGNGALYSSEHSTTSKRPYTVFEYASNAYASSFAGAGLYKNTMITDDSWYNDGLQYLANCYGYALRIYGDAHRCDELYSQTPGEFARKVINAHGLTINVNINGYSDDGIIFDNQSLIDLYDMQIFVEDTPETAKLEWIYQLMKVDAEQLSQAVTFTITKSSASEIVNSTASTNQRMIALIVSDSDYHFYMQHSDGTWSHKPGNYPPTNICLDGHGNTNQRKH